MLSLSLLLIALLFILARLLGEIFPGAGKSNRVISSVLHLDSGRSDGKIYRFSRRASARLFINSVQIYTFFPALKLHRGRPGVAMCNQEKLTALLDSKLELDERLELLYHLDICQNCFMLLYDLRKARDEKFFRRKKFLELPGRRRRRRRAVTV